MKIISGGQSGVDYGGWCPKGGWAEDFPEPPGLLAQYPQLKETELSHPLQRTEWNVRDSDATLIITDGKGLAASIGTTRALQWARQHGKPFLIVDAGDQTAPARATGQRVWSAELSWFVFRFVITFSSSGLRL